MRRFPTRTLPAAVALLCAQSAAQAAGFALLEQNASGAGVAFAGKAALGEDASAAWYNPAATSRLKERQLVLGAHIVDLNADFNATSSTPPPGRPAGSAQSGFGDMGYIPNFHAVLPYDSSVNFALSVTAPFGLKTDYAPDWAGRFQGVTSDIKSLNINPSVSWQVNDGWSVGAGISAQKLDAKLTSVVNFTPFGGTEGLTSIEGAGWGYGFNLGVLGQLTPDTRVGVAYRSSIEHDLEGNVTFNNVPAPVAAVFSNSALTSKIRLPASFAVSSVTRLDPKWQLLTDATWTEWSTIQQLDFQRNNAGPAAAPLTVQDYAWKNSWRFAVGGIYKYSDRVNLKGGLAYDLSPVPDERRAVRLPDEDRYTLAVGSQYLIDRKTTVDVALQFVKPKNANVNRTEGNAAAGQQSSITGQADGHAVILSAQLAYKF